MAITVLLVLCCLNLLEVHTQQSNWTDEKICMQPIPCPNNKIIHYLFTRETAKRPFGINDGDDRELIRSVPFVRDRPLIVLLTGADPDLMNHDLLTKNLGPAYFKTGDYNLLITDYSYYVGQSFCPAISAIFMGRCISKFLRRVYHYFPEFKPENTHTLCVSYGCLVAGYIGDYFNGDIYRITAFDPAQTLRSVPSGQTLPYPLHPKVAKIVDVFHTSMGELGIWNLVGTVDVVFNDGTFQPGCYDVPSYSHVAGIFYYVTSILYNRSLLGRPCKYRVYEYLTGETDHICPPLGDHNNYHVLGEHMSPGLRGTYLVYTSPDYPYSLGEWNNIRTYRRNFCKKKH